MPPFFRPLLFCTVFTTGAAVLIFEVAAVRALSPYFGTSIYVVSSVLTVILAALSLGYYYGGRLADQQPDVRLLYIIIALAGLIMNGLYALSLAIFPIMSSFLPITLGPLILSISFFLLPAFLLGIDSPFVIKLLTSIDTQHNGAVVGSTFFWSTVGSIAGSLASGFLLIPFAGLKLTFLGTATLLSILACAAYISLHPNVKKQSFPLSLRWIFGICLVSVVLAAVTFRFEPPSTSAGDLLYRTDGYYSQIEIKESHPNPNRTIRTLHREINHSSAIEMGTTTFAFQYPEYVRAYRTLPFEAETFLMIGGGAYTIPRTLLAEDPNLMIDVVEIEPKLFDLAHQYFDLPEPDRLRNYTMDARSFLATNTNTYDVIYVDAFQSGHFIPSHLVTREFFASLKAHLTPRGILIANTIGQIDKDEISLLGSLYKTMQSEFPSLQVFAASNDFFPIGNFAVIARNDKTPLVSSSDFLIDRKNGEVVPAAKLELSLSRFHLDKQVILTDDKAPVELLVAKQILEY